MTPLSLTADVASLPQFSGTVPSAVGRGWQRAIGRAEGEAWFEGPLAQGRGIPVRPADITDLLEPAPSVARPGIEVSLGLSRTLTAATSVAVGSAEAITAAPSVSSPEGRPQVTSVAAAPSAQAAAAVPPFHAAAAPSAQAAMPVSPPSRAAAVVPTGASVPGGVPAADAASETDPAQPTHRSTARQPHAAASQPALHVHVEHQADGAHVWLGAPAATAAALLRHLDLPALQKLLAVRVAALTCNGVPVASGGTNPRYVVPPGPAGSNQEP